MTEQAYKAATREPLFVSASYRGAGSAWAAKTQRDHGTAAKSAPRWRIARFISDNLQDELASDIRFQPLVVIYKSLMRALKGRVISRSGATGDDI